MTEINTAQVLAASYGMDWDDCQDTIHDLCVELDETREELAYMVSRWAEQGNRAALAERRIAAAPDSPCDATWHHDCLCAETRHALQP